MKEHEKRIREALEAVPLPHDWKVCEEPANEYWFAGRTIGAADPADARRVADTCELDPNAEKFAQYIAACEPTALRALLADLDAMRVALGEAEEWVQEYVTQMRSYVISDSAAKSLTRIRNAIKGAEA